MIKLLVRELAVHDFIDSLGLLDLLNVVIQFLFRNIDADLIGENLLVDLLQFLERLVALECPFIPAADMASHHSLFLGMTTPSLRDSRECFTSRR